MTFGNTKTRNDFPALGQMVRGKPLVYLDSAATTLKPRSVIDTINQYYQFETANVHRGSHYLSDRATEKFESVRIKVQKFLNAQSAQEIVFTSGTTDSINLVAQTLGAKFLKTGDEIVLSQMEHHSNIVPWQLLAAERGLKIQWAKVTDAGEIDKSHFLSLLSKKTKIVSLVHCSNALGTVNDLAELFSEAKKVGAWTVVDAAQSVSFLSVDVQKLGCDFLAFSAHKIYGPYGVGVLYGRQAVLEMLPPYRGGGAMISSVTEAKSEFLPPPQRFEAGTPNISGVIGMGAAIDYMQEFGAGAIAQHERSLLGGMVDKLSQISGIEIMGASPSRTNLVSFNVRGVHGADIGQILDQQGVAVRAGHHCTQPLMKRFGVTGSVRASLGVYNSMEDVDIFIQALKKSLEMLK